MIYLDNSATTPVRPEVRDYISELMAREFGNPSALYDLGLKSNRILKNARMTIGRALGAAEEEIYFTASGSEANNLAIKGLAETYIKRGRHIVTTAVEHPSVLRTMEYLAAKGWEITYLPVDSQGNVNLADLAQSLRRDTVLVAMMMVNNEVGTIFPIAEAGKIIKQQAPDCHFHVDGVQAFGRLAVNVKNQAIDTFALSGHKIGAPKGVGALYVKKGLRLTPLIHGGGQERGLRAGTENVYYIGGLALATKLSLTDRAAKNEKTRQLKEALLSGLTESGVEYKVNGEVDKTAPYILNLEFPHVASEPLLHFLEGRGIYVSQGSACHAKTKGSSETLKAMGRDDRERGNALRFSFGDDTSLEDLPQVVAGIKEGVAII